MFCFLFFVIKLTCLQGFIIVKKSELTHARLPHSLELIQISKFSDHLLECQNLWVLWLEAESDEYDQLNPAEKETSGIHCV